ncbi:MAG: hypothetical protein K8S20_15215 [Chloroflexi bacterium]|nr:hypothetical protein [Chloroflexota bacterium]
MQPVYAILASGTWLFLSGAILFAVVFPKWFKTNFGQIVRDGKEIPLWAVAIEKLLQSLGLVLAVQWTQHSILVLIALPLLFVTATYLFSTYANYRVNGRAVLVIALLDALRLIVAMILVGLILGRALI